MNVRLILRKLPLTAFLLATLAPAILIAQSPPLTLADLLVGLRSKKVSLEDRNRILAEAVIQRGVTFALMPEIEKELSATGADSILMAAIRQKAQPAPKPTPEVVKPAPTPTPPDFSFYKVRAESNAGKGDFATALADYNKSIELKPDNSATWFSRGQTHFSMKSYDLAVADFTRAVDLNPKDSMAFTNRGLAFEKLSETKKAMADYKMAVELSDTNETARASLKRLMDEEAALAAKNQPPPPAPKPVPMKPEIVDLGTITGANAVKMVTPVYPQLAQRSNIEGKVSVNIELDDAGNVIKATATTGHQMLRAAAEDAAEKSKFKPASFDGKPIKAKAVVVYNFTLRSQ